MDKGGIGEMVATIGAGMLALSMALVFVFAESGQPLHNVLQIGGFCLLAAGFVLWKVGKV